MEFKSLLGVTAIIIGIAGYAPYFRDMLRNKTKPHAFSWLVWGVLTAIAFVGQVISNGGPGTWVTGFTALIGLVIFAVALKKGKKDFPLIDWLCLVGAGVAILLWRLTNDPLSAVILVSIIDVVGFIPTFRKSIHKPSEETLSTYALSGIKYIVGIFALDNYALVTILYPLSIVFTNFAFVTLLLLRRKQLGL